MIPNKNRSKRSNIKMAKRRSMAEENGALSDHNPKRALNTASRMSNSPLRRPDTSSRPSPNKVPYNEWSEEPKRYPSRKIVSTYPEPRLHNDN